MKHYLKPMRRLNFQDAVDKFRAQELLEEKPSKYMPGKVLPQSFYAFDGKKKQSTMSILHTPYSIRLKCHNCNFPFGFK